jgi:hypothetical protein
MPFFSPVSSQEICLLAQTHTRTSSFFDHRDPEKVKWLGNRKLDV